MTPPEKLQIYLFGTPKVVYGRVLLAIPRSQHRALLYRLAVASEPVNREHLCFLFWADTDDATARRRLTQSLSHLRRALPNPDILIGNKESVYLDAGQVWVDSSTLATLSRGRDIGVKQRHEAVALYSGPFLQGVSLPECPEYEHWQQCERHHYEQLYLDALMALLVDATARSAYAEALGYARRYLAVDELAEAVHRRLIELHAANGNRAAAASQFEECNAILKRELGVEPLPETRAAYAAALVEPALPVSQVVPDLGWTTLASLAMPLVGRDEVLVQMEQCFAKATRGEGNVLLIAGEAGIGKSRIVQEFATRWQADALVLAGAGQVGEHRLPYQPLAQALRRGIAILGARLALDPLWLAEASLALPELRTLFTDLPPPLVVSPNQARTRLIEALSQLTIALATLSQPMLLCLDDLHWTDTATLDWLAYFGSQLRQQPLLVIATYRLEEPDSVASLRHALYRAGTLTEIGLVGLDASAVYQLLHHADPTLTEPHGLAQYLGQATRGNSFFLLETLRGFLETQRPLQELQQMKWLPVPATVSETVTIRLNRLTPVARQMLETGAALGLAFSYDNVQRTSGRTELEAVEGLDELVARYLLRDEADGFQFQHEIIHRVVYQSLSRWRRRLLHRRAAEVLELLHGTDLDAVSGQLAAHYEEAQLPERAILFYTRAATVALRLYAHAEAVNLLNQGLRLLHAMSQSPEHQQQELEMQIMLGSELIATHGFSAPGMKHAYERAWILAQQVENRLPLFPAMWGMWSFMMTGGQLQTAREMAERLLEFATEDEDADNRLEAWRALSSTLFHMGDFARAREVQEVAMARYDRAKHHDHIGQYGADPGIVTLSMLTNTLWMLGYPDQAQERCNELLRLSDELSHPFSSAFAWVFATWFYQFCRDYERLQECAESAIVLTSQHGFEQTRAMAGVLKGWTLAEYGQVEDGIVQMEHAIEAWQSTGSGIGTPYWRCLLASAYGRMGHTAEALDLLAESLADMEQRSERRGQPELYRLRGELLWGEGASVAEVELSFQQALAVAHNQHALSLELRAAMSLACLWQGQGEDRRAYELLAPIYGRFTEGFGTQELQEARALLDELV